jgi:cell division protein FtsX
MPHANRLSDRLETVIEIKRKMRKERNACGSVADKIEHVQNVKSHNALSTAARECLHCVNI